MSAYNLVYRGKVFQENVEYPSDFFIVNDGEKFIRKTIVEPRLDIGNNHLCHYEDIEFTRLNTDALSS